MAFDAGKVVEALDWDLRPYVDAHGTVPEPTDDEIRTMNDRLREITVATVGADFDPTDRTAALKAFASLTAEDVEKFADAQLDAVVVVTKDSPSRETLAGTPPRIRMKFIKWLMQELNDPEGLATATTP